MLLADFLSNHRLTRGLGTADRPCSMGAINLILNGRLMDDVPDCMSFAIGRFIIKVQDSMPSPLRNSSEWKALLPLAAGTGREKDWLRRYMLIDWMWGVLTRIQYVADNRDFGSQWAAMIEDRTELAALNAETAAARDSSPICRFVSIAAAHAAGAVHDDHLLGNTKKANAVDFISQPTAAVIAAAEANYGLSTWDFWFTVVDPCKMLKKLIEI